jgi:membrane fusion protein, copper/silver efflux system
VKFRHWIGLSALGAVAVFVLVACLEALPGPPPRASTAALEQAVAVIDSRTLRLSPVTVADLGTTKAAIRDFPETLDVQGNISVVENEVTVVPCRVGNARVDAVLKVTGDTVHAGDALASIFSPDFVSAREEYLQLAGGSASDSGDLSGFATQSLEKLERMGLTPGDIARLAKPGDNHLVVRALRNGVITEVNTMVGNLQNEGDTLFMTANLDKVWFSGDLYVEDLPKVRTGQRITINAEGLDKPLHGTISFVSPVLDPTVHTVKVRAIINNPDHLLRAAMFVEGRLVLSDAPALVVPEGAVLALNGKTYCFKALGNGCFRETPVSVGREENGTAGITGGLGPGDEIISNDPATLDYVLDSARTDH